MIQQYNWSFTQPPDDGPQYHCDICGIITLLYTSWGDPPLDEEEVERLRKEHRIGCRIDYWSQEPLPFEVDIFTGEVTLG